MVRTFLRTAGLMAGLVGILAGAALPARTASADQIVPVAAAVSGAANSDWHSDLVLSNPHGVYLDLDLVFTPRGQSMSASDPTIPVSLAPGETRVFEDVYRLGFPGKDGAARILIDMQEDPATGKDYPAPVVDFSVYDLQTDGGTKGQSPSIIDAETLGTGTSRAIRGRDGTRTNVFVMTGSEGATISWTAYGPAGDLITQSSPITYVADATTQIGGNATWSDGTANLFNTELPAYASIDAQIIDGSASLAFTINDNITNDSRWIDFTTYEAALSPEDVAIQYVAKWLPESRFYLSNTEARAMINGGQGTRSYARDLAEVLVTAPVAAGTSVDDMEQWLYQMADGQITSGTDDLCSSWDPMLWDNDAQGQPAFALYHAPACATLTDFDLDAESMRTLREVISGLHLITEGELAGYYEPTDGFLIGYVANNPSHYGGVLHGSADMDHNPTWNTQDLN